MRQWIVDAFAAAPFKGNPAAVVEPFDAWPDAMWMQALAQENNQAETAFLLKTTDPARFGLRWFTPMLEVPLCGHATLASGHVLSRELGLGEAKITFDTKSGPLTVQASGDLYEMDFPADPPRRVEAPEGLAEALGAEPLEVWAGQYVVAVLESEQVVRDLEPDLAAVQVIACGVTGIRGNLAAAAFADPGQPYQVVSRFFAPGSGIPEDPATGSAHCILSPLFADKLGQARIAFHQAFPGRGGDIVATLNGPRVILAGQAVTVIESRLRL
jgi:PhzF family phenazine biosynthesis protein